ncbi:MAG: hypothetical protein E7208_11635 [Clostridium butyricum]|nr:hypothetical protein [Clostridium butyricum]
MKRKISTTLAVTLIASQMQSVAFAKDINNIKETNVIKEDVSQTTEKSDNDILTESPKDEVVENVDTSNDVETTEKDEIFNDEITTEGDDTNNGGEVTEGDGTSSDEVTKEDDNTSNGEGAIDAEDTTSGRENVEGDNTTNDDVIAEGDDTVNDEEITEDEEVIDDTVKDTDSYEAKGKLELDLNFSLPIKFTNADETNISVKLREEGENGFEETIRLGSDTEALKIESKGINYELEALDYKRKKIEDSDTELEFYHLTFDRLPLGTYSLEISGAGYETVLVDNIEIQDSSKRVLIGTSDKKIVIDDEKEVYYPGAFLAGNVDGNDLVTDTDYESLKNKIKNKSENNIKNYIMNKIKIDVANSDYDLNRDGQVDITDLTYIHQNMNKEKSDPVILDTDLILNPETVDIEVDGAEIYGDISDILKNNGTGVSLKSNGEEISEDNPILLSMNLGDSKRSDTYVEKLVIEAPSNNAPSAGSIIIPKGDGTNLEFKFKNSQDRKSTRKTSDGTLDVIEIDLKDQIAVSEITIKVTGGRGNKNLTEISKVEFLNNVYTEIPKPKMNVPVINNFKSTTQVGNESMTLGWEHVPNVTGYEIKVEKLDDYGKKVVSTSTYKTSKNTLRIEKVDGYAVYRVSIQSTSGDWKSGYKDEQDDYIVASTGDTNLTNNENDKDGKPDNVDANYNTQGWDSETGKLSSNEDGENGRRFGADSIVELQVIPETAPEGPEGIKIEGGYKALNISWASHKKAKDYDLYYREIGTKKWIKANDQNKDYEDSDLTNEIPDEVVDLKPDEKADKDELIRATNYTISGLKDTTTYEIMMTATNHHGTGGLSKSYIGSTANLVIPITTNYNLINSSNGENELTNHIEKVEFPSGKSYDEDSVVDNDYSTAWTLDNWDSSIYNKRGPIVTFDQEYTLDTINLITRLDINSQPYSANIGIWNEETEVWEYKTAKVNLNNKVVTLKLDEPITVKKVQVNISVYPTIGSGKVSVSEIKFYKYDSLEKDIDNLFTDDLKLSIQDDVNQEMIDELTKRAKTIDPINMEYHFNQKEILEDLQRAQDLLNDVKLSDRILKLDTGITNQGQTIGQSNNWQALGVAVKPGDKVTVYIGSERKDTKFNLAITQHYGESGSYITNWNQKLTVGKNEITIPNSSFNMNYEKGGNLYINFDSGYNETQEVQVRVSGGTRVPHLNLNNMIDDTTKEAEVKQAIRTYIRELKSYVSTLSNRYPEYATAQDNANNVYTYDPETSILNSTEIEGERITLSLPADQILKGIEADLSGNEEAEVNRVYDTLLAWEQLMKVSYAQQGLLEKAIDLDGNGEINSSESDYFNANRAPKNRINIKYQRMFTGAFMYASGHHVGIGYGSTPSIMQGVPFKFDVNGNLVNKDEGNLFGWGINHEIGHVHDRTGLTYAETTNNILALISQTFDDVDASRLELSDAYKNVYDKVTSGSVGLASDGLTRLGMFWQLHLAYDNDYTYRMLDNNTDNDFSNDTFYAKLYRETRKKGIAFNELGQDFTAQTFIMRSSDAVGKDLRPFFEKWGLVASPKTNEYLNSKDYPVENKAIYYLNDEARRKRLAAMENNNMSAITMAEDTKVNANFGTDKNGVQITEKTYLNQKEVPLNLSVNKDADKILGYEIIRKEATVAGSKEVPVGFIERDKVSENGATKFTDVIDSVNNRVFEYKVRAYDYDLNVTAETVIGNVKVNHDGSISKNNWVFDTNTRSTNDVSDENTGHGQVQGGEINKIRDNDVSTVYNASKVTNQNGAVASGDPYVTVDMASTKSVVGLKYTPGQIPKKKFSLMNFFKRNTEITYSPISKYEVYVSKDGKLWTKAHSGTFDTTKENTIYFNESGNNNNTQLWAYDAQYVKLVAKGSETISIAELDILGPTGDNIEIGIDNDDKVYKNGLGRLSTEYTYAPGKSIPAGSIIITGEYKGDPSFNVPLVLNEKDENFAIESKVILLANLPEDSKLGEVAEGNWIYWITPEQENKIIDGENNIEGTAVKAELYRYNKLDESGNPVGQRLVSDTFLLDLPVLGSLPSIDLNSGKTRSLSTSYDKVVEINNDIMKKAYENR